MATLRRQCRLFAIGSTLFAIATAPGVSALAGACFSNLLCFVGSWFFTTAGWMQLVLAKPVLGIGWLSAATQSAGTVLFNISTGAALWAHAVEPERRLVWTPDAIGSSAFLISGVLGVVAVTVTVGLTELNSPGWQAEWINLVGCVAFGVSAVGAYVSGTGVTEDAMLANRRNVRGCALLPVGRASGPAARAVVAGVADCCGKIGSAA